MGHNSTRARRTVFRLVVLTVCVLLASAVTTVASATSTKDKLDAAKRQFEQLKNEIAAQQKVVDQLNQQAAAIAVRWDAAQAKFEQITDQLRNTVNDLRQAQTQYQQLQTTLAERAREAYITGPGSDLEFVLGASSLSDLSARMEYVNALSQEDVDLATQVQNVKNTLAAQKADQMKLQAQAAKAFAAVDTLRQQVEAKFQQAQQIMNELAQKKAQAEQLVKKLGKQYQQELAAATGLKFVQGGILQVCPVGQPHAVYNGFGAPRYSGGYHPHAGNDILAPQGTPIYATFDGYARASYNSLGGNSVSVYGPNGYTYNAHLEAPGYTGPVHAGDVIGHVGATGDTNTPHDHFEWHPNVTPTNWPVSPYGYSVIDTGSQPAVNPWPLLEQVC